MKQYLLSIYQPDGGVPAPEVLEPIVRNLGALEEEMRAAGVWVFSGGLHPPDTATVIRVKDGDTLMTDGPYTEGKEHLGGFTVIRAPDLDEALEWGRRLALAIGLLPVEVRPFQGEAG
ncbi:YciI family protein [Streptosporangium sp. NPDC000563]|uniref:YciI family protein n=1 Tax=unclassified Streptosporangium TaxID=2632669 RepID=UPI00331A10B8